MKTTLSILYLKTDDFYTTPSCDDITMSDITQSGDRKTSPKDDKHFTLKPLIVNCNGDYKERVRERVVMFNGDALDVRLSHVIHNLPQ